MRQFQQTDSQLASIIEQYELLRTRLRNLSRSPDEPRTIYSRVVQYLEQAKQDRIIKDYDARLSSLFLIRVTMINDTPTLPTTEDLWINLNYYS